MKTTIDAAGRVVIPKSIRESARIHPGSELEVELVGDVIEIRPIPGSVRLERKGGLLVAVADDVEPLQQSTVDATLADTRARHLPEATRRKPGKRRAQ
jgi:AbrB family looped-hinge helix DNA binding protein